MERYPEDRVFYIEATIGGKFKSFLTLARDREEALLLLEDYSREAWDNLVTIVDMGRWEGVPGVKEGLENDGIVVAFDELDVINEEELNKTNAESKKD